MFVLTEESWFYSRQEKYIYCSLNAPDHLYGPAKLLFNGYLALFRQGKRVRSLKLITNLQVVVYPHSHVCIHGVHRRS